MKTIKLKSCRLQRVKTGSWLTCELPQPMSNEDAYLWLADNMPGWEFDSGDYIMDDSPDDRPKPF